MTSNQILAKVGQLLDQYHKGHTTATKAPVATIEPSTEPQPPHLHQQAHDALQALNGAAPTKKILQRMRKIYKVHSNYNRVYMALEYRKRKFGDVDRSEGVWRLERAKGNKRARKTH